MSHYDVMGEIVQLVAEGSITPEQYEEAMCDFDYAQELIAENG